MPTDIKITLSPTDADELASLYAAQIATAADLAIAREQEKLAWRLAEVYRLTAARQAGKPEAVSYDKQPIHERDGSEAPRMDEASALLAAARAIDAPAVKGAPVKDEGKEPPALTPVEAALAAHDAAHAAYGACVQRCCAGHETEIAEVMSKSGSRFAVEIATGEIVAEYKKDAP
jgi:hypothetical protein